MSRVISCLQSAAPGKQASALYSTAVDESFRHCIDDILSLSEWFDFPTVSAGLVVTGGTPWLVLENPWSIATLTTDV
jgi:hypothetical protein